MAWASRWATTTTTVFRTFSFLAWARADYFATPAKAHLSMPREQAAYWESRDSALRRCGWITTATAFWIYLCAIMCGGLRSRMFSAAWMERINRFALQKPTAAIPAGCFTTEATARLRTSAELPGFLIAAPSRLVSPCSITIKTAGRIFLLLTIRSQISSTAIFGTESLKMSPSKLVWLLAPRERRGLEWASTP